MEGATETKFGAVNLFSYSSMHHQPWGEILHNGLSPPPSITHKDNTLQASLQGKLRRHFFSVKIFSFQKCLCIQLAKSINIIDPLYFVTHKHTLDVKW